MTSLHSEREWCDRVVWLLLSVYELERAAAPSALAAWCPRLGIQRTATQMLRADERFERAAGGFRVRAGTPLPPMRADYPLMRNAVLRRLLPANAEPPPGYRAPTEAWAIVLSVDAVWARELTEWRWLWVLPQVSRLFAETLRPLRTRLVQLMCAGDRRGRIWRAKANELFVLSPRELDPLDYVEVPCAWHRRRVMHMLSRAEVLVLAFARHKSERFEALAAAYTKRRARRLRLQDKRAVASAGL